MRISLIQAAIQISTPEENERRLLEMVRTAAQTSDLVVLPEMWTSGIHPELSDSSAVERTPAVIETLLEVSRATGCEIISGSLPLRENAGISNAAWLITPSGTQGPYRKVHLFRLGGEDRITRAGKEFPLLETAGGRCGIFICYDLRFSEIFRSATFRGARILVVMAQWPAVRRAHWETLLAARAIENQAFVLGCSLTGHDGLLEFAGSSCVIDPWGNVLVAAGVEETVLQVDIEPGEVDRIRERYPFLQDACWREQLRKLGGDCPGSEPARSS